MTESASGSSRSTLASTSEYRVGAAAILRRRASRLDGETPANEPSKANSRFRRWTALGGGSTGDEVAPVSGEEDSSLPDLIQSEWELCEVYLAGGGLNPSESLAVTRHSAYGFG